MSYRRRGGLNGGGGIIRPSSYRNPHEAAASTQTTQTTASMLNPGDETPGSTRQVPASFHLETSILNEDQAANTDNQRSNEAATITSTMSTQPLGNSIHNGDNDRQNGISDEMGNPEKTDYVLHPDGLWFPHRGVVDIIAETSYKSYFKGPYCNWSMTPPEVQQRWWNAFKNEFSWDPSVAKAVKKGWKSKCSRRLTDMVSKLCSNPNYVAAWCPPTIRDEMNQIRGVNEDFKKRSQQCAKNRNANADQKVHHRQGSISTDEVRLKLVKKLGREPTATELYYDTHADSGGRFVNAKAEEVWNNFTHLKNANLESENPKTEDVLFLEAVGGWTDKGRIFGLGAAADSLYQRPGIEEKKAKKSRREYTLELENKYEEQKKELTETKESLIATQKSLAETQKILATLTQQVQLLAQDRELSLTPTSTSSSP